MSSNYWRDMAQKCAEDNVAISKLRWRAEKERDDLLAVLNRYRYAVHFASAEAWDQAAESRSRFEWARARDPGGSLEHNKAAEISRAYHEDTALRAAELYDHGAALVDPLISPQKADR